MNDVEKAIIIITNTDNIEVNCCYCPIRNECKEIDCIQEKQTILKQTILQALQEKAEREKGCKYCTGENPESITICDGDEIFYMDYDKSFHNRDLKLDWISCPNCGRDLRKDDAE